MAMKRKNDTANAEANEKTGKRARLSEDQGRGEGTSALQTGGPSGDVPAPAIAVNSVKGKEKASRNDEKPSKFEPGNGGVDKSGKKARNRIRKLAPMRPFPLVPTSVSATGPRSAHKEGKNVICITRRNGLSAYLRRCKEVIIKDGYKKLHLSAMGAAIPLLLQLSCALPPILPFDKEEISTEILTGTCEVQDEVLPEDDDEDIAIQSRFKSTLQVVITIGDGQFAGDTTGPARRTKPLGKGPSKSGSKKGEKVKRSEEAEDVFYEPEQEEEDLMETV